MWNGEICIGEIYVQSLNSINIGTRLYLKQVYKSKVLVQLTIILLLILNAIH